MDLIWVIPGLTKAFILYLTKERKGRESRNKGGFWGHKYGSNGGRRGGIKRRDGGGRSEKEGEQKRFNEGVRRESNQSSRMILIRVVDEYYYISKLPTTTTVTPLISQLLDRGGKHLGKLDERTEEPFFPVLSPTPNGGWLEGRRLTMHW